MIRRTHLLSEEATLGSSSRGEIHVTLPPEIYRVWVASTLVAAAILQQEHYCYVLVLVQAEAF